MQSKNPEQTNKSIERDFRFARPSCKPLCAKTMTTEFTKLNSEIITPLMKSKGFKKVGKYDYGATFDKAVYKDQDRELEVIYTVHPYDYPYHGINIEERLGGEVIQKKYYSFEAGDLRALLESLAKDISEGAICA